MSNLDIKLARHEAKTRDLPDVMSEKQLQRVSTGRVRYALSQLAQNNIERVQELLDAIEVVDGPKAAFDSLMKLLEYSIPKLSRTEVKVEDTAGNAVVAELDMEALQEIIRRGVNAELRTIEGTAEEVEDGQII